MKRYINKMSNEVFDPDSKLRLRITTRGPKSLEQSRLDTIITNHQTNSRTNEMQSAFPKDFNPREEAKMHYVHKVMEWLESIGTLVTDPLSDTSPSQKGTYDYPYYRVQRPYPVTASDTCSSISTSKEYCEERQWRRNTREAIQKYREEPEKWRRPEGVHSPLVDANPGKINVSPDSGDLKPQFASMLTSVGPSQRARRRFQQ